MLYIPSLDIRYTGRGLVSGHPKLDDRRALVPKIEFAHQGGEIVDEHAVLDGDQLHPFAAKGFADLPLPPLHLYVALGVDFQHPGSRRVFPARWSRIVAARTGTPQGGWSFHAQRFVRPHMVVFSTIGIQPKLQMLARETSEVQGPRQLSVKPFDLALCLRVPYAAPAQADPLAHQPQRQFGSTRRGLLIPPGRAVIHQQSFRKATALKRRFQLLPYGLAIGAAVNRQPKHVAARRSLARPAADTVAAVRIQWDVKCQIHRTKNDAIATFERPQLQTQPVAPEHP
jgi:hypothetical protein